MNGDGDLKQRFEPSVSGSEVAGESLLCELDLGEKRSRTG
jgi:hypothetical protein